MNDKQSIDNNKLYINLLELPLILLKHWLFIFLFTICSIIVSIIYSGSIKEKFYSYVEIEFRSGSEKGSVNNIFSGKYGMSSNLPGLLGSSQTSEAEFYGHIAQTPRILDKIIETNHLKDAYQISSMRALRLRVLNRVKININDFNLLEIGYTDNDKELAYQIVKSFIFELENFYKWRSREISESGLNEINNILHKINEEISVAKNQLKEFQEKYGVFDIDQYSKSLSKQLADLKMQLIKAQLDYKEKYSEYKLLGKLTNRELQIYKEKIAIIQAEIDKIKNISTKENLAYNDLPKVNLEYLDIYTNLKSLNLISEQLRLAYNVNRLNANRDVEAMIIVNDPHVATEKFYPYRSRIVKKFAIIAFFIAIFLTFIFEFLYRALLLKENQKLIRDFLDSFSLKKKFLAFIAFIKKQEK